jgi:mono/diheme cytochrome c family protein
MAVLGSGPVQAQSIGDLTAGRMIAATLCVQCHRITGSDNDPDRTPPDFGAVANMRSFTALSMRVFLQTPHGQMPRYQFNQTEMDDIVAYLSSLRQP